MINRYMLFITFAVTSAFSVLAHSASYSVESLKEKVAASSTILIGKVKDIPERKPGSGFRVTLDSVQLITKNGLLPVVYSETINVNKDSFNNNLKETPIFGGDTSDPALVLGSRYLLFSEIDINGTQVITDDDAYLISDSDDIYTQDGVPIILNEKGFLRRSRANYIISDREKAMLKYTDGATDEILYVSTSQVRYTEKPTKLSAVIEAIIKMK